MRSLSSCSQPLLHTAARPVAMIARLQRLLRKRCELHKRPGLVGRHIITVWSLISLLRSGAQKSARGQQRPEHAIVAPVISVTCRRLASTMGDASGRAWATGRIPHRVRGVVRFRSRFPIHVRVCGGVTDALITLSPGKNPRLSHIQVLRRVEIPGGLAPRSAEARVSNAATDPQCTWAVTGQSGLRGSLGDAFGCTNRVRR